MSLRICLIFCLFIRVMVVGSPLKTRTCLVIGPDNGARYSFQLVEWVLNPSRKWLVTPMTFMPLLHQRACLARLVIAVVHRVHS